MWNCIILAPMIVATPQGCVMNLFTWMLRRVSGSWQLLHEWLVVPLLISLPQLPDYWHTATANRLSACSMFSGPVFSVPTCTQYAHAESHFHLSLICTCDTLLKNKAKKCDMWVWYGKLWLHKVIYKVSYHSRFLANTVALPLTT